MTMRPSQEIQDEWNRSWLSRVKPEDWVNPVPRGRYNLVVVGGGTAGLVAAAGAAGLGAKVALVERHRLGGDCLNTGCVPSKVLLAEARRASGQSPQLRFQEVMRTIRQRRAEISQHDSAERFTRLGVDVYFGSAKFTSSTTLSVGEAVLKFKKACVATGGRPALPDVPGINEQTVLTHESVFSLESLPASLLILGGGPIGCEMAESFAEMGSVVTLLERGERILGRDDPEASSLVLDSLAQRGVRVVTGARLESLQPSDGGQTASYIEGGKSRELEVEQVLVCTGRKPNVGNMGLQEIGVDFDSADGIQVNDRLQTRLKNIYAAGDVCTAKKFTHHADFMSRLVLKNALFFGRSKASKLVVPWCTYTSPEVAHVGISAYEAREDGVAITTLTVPFTEVDRALLEGETRGFIRVHLKSGSDRILGATAVGPHAGDLICELTVAMQNGLGLTRLGNTMHPYPTRADAIRKLGDAYGRTRLTPRVKQLFAAWLRFQR